MVILYGHLGYYLFACSLLLASLAQLLGPIGYRPFWLFGATEPWLPEFRCYPGCGWEFGIVVAGSLLSCFVNQTGICSAAIEQVRFPRSAACGQVAVVFAGSYYALPDDYGVAYITSSVSSGDLSAHAFSSCNVVAEYVK